MQVLFQNARQEFGVDLNAECRLFLKAQPRCGSLHQIGIWQSAKNDSCLRGPAPIDSSFHREGDSCSLCLEGKQRSWVAREIHSSQSKCRQVSAAGLLV